jgi:hypothetical protein
LPLVQSLLGVSRFFLAVTFGPLDCRTRDCQRSGSRPDLAHQFMARPVIHLTRFALKSRNYSKPMKGKFIMDDLRNSELDCGSAATGTLHRF